MRVNCIDQMPERNVVSWIAMLSGYVRGGQIEEARCLFEKMTERNIISWNIMLSAYLQKGRMEDAHRLFDIMPERNVVSWNANVAAYARKGRMEIACALFDEMSERDVYSWTSMVAGYCQSGRLEDARHMFDKMPERNVASWNAMLAGYTQNSGIEDARCLFDKMPERGVASWNSIITGYAQCGRVQEARHLFDIMPSRSVVSWTSMIIAYAQTEQGEDALKFFSQMLRDRVKPDPTTFTSLLRACTSLAALEEGKQLHEYMIKLGIQLDSFVGSALISMYAKCGLIEDARLMFDIIVNRDGVYWNAKIAGYAQRGFGNEALKMFEELQRTGVKPNEVTFIGILSACSHAGLVDKGLRYFNSMYEDYCIAPRAEHYACITDLLGRAGRLEEAKEFVNKATCEPNSSMWGALLLVSDLLTMLRENP